ncbi:M20/M25/M40 family metallo-hydrolase [Chloroflexi bacterium TSY]|nr:M20/M25/M40 family metallo-hydrolase [Chloroflexi bacterium TSY]
MFKRGKESHVGLDVIQLASDLIAFDSDCRRSNESVSDYLEEVLKRTDFDVERLSYQDENDERKVSLVARKGEGQGGFGLFSHSDTVPGGEGWDPTNPVVEKGRLIGRGACDMKGPLAATIVAGANTNASELIHPLYIIATADEERGYGGAKQIIAESELLKDGWPTYSVVAEPTELIPVYAHKGGTAITVTAHGRAAHTSTNEGISANLLMAPFFGEMAELAKLFQDDDRFMNHEFTPPTNGFNIVINDGNTRSNVTAAKTTCIVSIRSMTNDHHEEAIQLVVEKAKKHNLEVEWRSGDPFYTQPDATMVQSALKATGVANAATVPFGTEASVYHLYTEAVILGPGSIKQAHTLGEWIDLGQLTGAVGVYEKLIESHCILRTYPKSGCESDQLLG